MAIVLQDPGIDRSGEQGAQFLAQNLIAQGQQAKVDRAAVGQQFFESFKAEADSLGLSMSQMLEDPTYQQSVYGNLVGMTGDKKSAEQMFERLKAGRPTVTQLANKRLYDEIDTLADLPNWDTVVPGETKTQVVKTITEQAAQEGKTVTNEMIKEGMNEATTNRLWSPIAESMGVEPIGGTPENPIWGDDFKAVRDNIVNHYSDGKSWLDIKGDKAAIQTMISKMKSGEPITKVIQTIVDVPGQAGDSTLGGRVAGDVAASEEFNARQDRVANGEVSAPFAVAPGAPVDVREGMSEKELTLSGISRHDAAQSAFANSRNVDTSREVSEGTPVRPFDTPNEQAFVPDLADANVRTGDGGPGRVTPARTTIASGAATTKQVESVKEVPTPASFGQLNDTQAQQIVTSEVTNVPAPPEAKLGWFSSVDKIYNNALNQGGAMAQGTIAGNQASRMAEAQIMSEVASADLKSVQAAMAEIQIENYDKDSSMAERRLALDEQIGAVDIAYKQAVTSIALGGADSDILLKTAQAAHYKMLADAAGEKLAATGVVLSPANKLAMESTVTGWNKLIDTAIAKDFSNMDRAQIEVWNEQALIQVQAINSIPGMFATYKLQPIRNGGRNTSLIMPGGTGLGSEVPKDYSAENARTMLDASGAGASGYGGGTQTNIPTSDAPITGGYGKQLRE